jgi:hypothetical protein
MSDENLLEIVSTPVSTIEEVIVAMRRIDAELADTDGLKWFNLLYLKVTEAVLTETAGHEWEDPEWLMRLDVVFAGLYFNAVRNWIAAPATAPKSWRVLLDARQKPRVMRVQFALCGMNAHINHDLQFGLVQTCVERDVTPHFDSPQHRDFEFVNDILAAVEPGVKEFLATGIIGQIDQDLGRIDDIVGLWGIKKARETSWINAQVAAWPVRNISFLRNKQRESVDNFASVIGKGLIVPVA